jgi:cytidylate kinase
MRKNGIIIAVDGPSGAGKSTITRRLARRLGYVHLDTGAMYRTVALLALRQGISADADPDLDRLCAGLDIVFEREDGGFRVLANGEDVSALIRTPEISLLTSRVSARKVVRDHMQRLQRHLGENGGVILEGRDIGTVVFPDAEAKFFLSASVEERGRRRYLEHREKGEDVSLETTISEVAQRDAQDEQREHAPLRRADDAVDIDSTGLTIDQVLDTMERVVASRLALLSLEGARPASEQKPEVA